MERRLAAILAADVVGYARLMGDGLLAARAARPGEVATSRSNWPRLAEVAVPGNLFREILRRADYRNHGCGRGGGRG